MTRDQREQMIEKAARAIATSQYGDVWDNERARDTWVASATAALDAILPQLMLEEAWDEGSRAGWSDRTRSFMSAARFQPEPDGTPNPYRVSDETES